MLQVSECHDQVLLNNNAKHVGTNKIPEANYGKVKDGKNPKAKGTGRADPYTRGGNTPRGKGYGGRGMGRGGPPNVWRRDGGASPSGHGSTGPSCHKVQKAPKKPQAKRERVGNEPCYRCGDTAHWYKNCQASNRVTANYMRYRESRKQEAHYMKEECPEPNVNLTISDFNGKMDPAKSSDTPDFD
ncbi:uncharacterized protein LOC126795472 [Argentina anserina]|uniref:uncharacterized protein LOC126795472 n=1 Tax=Argentina anserina TaxID=57926 RepID=UPI002176935B|nr:uncharacterized protein LOC126795472 [Potentilla anserina]